MFPTSFFIFGLLALFYCQATNAGSLSALELRNEQSDLIAQILEIIKGLEALLAGAIADAIQNFTNVVKTIKDITDQVLGDGITVITNILGKVTEYISNRTAQANSLGVDISVCIVGRAKQIAQLNVEPARNLTTCVTNISGDVLTVVTKELEVINDIVRNITSLPLQLSKCLISLRPIRCLTGLLANSSKMRAELPGQIVAMVDFVLGLAKDLPVNLGRCVANISESAANQTREIIEQIGMCVDDAIANSTATSSTTTES